MPFQGILNDLVRSVPGVQGALLLDALGEVVMEAGLRNDRHRLIGAYQGIALQRIQRFSLRYGAGAVQCLVCRYAGGGVILRPLKDGYYVVVALEPGASLPLGVRRSLLAQDEMNRSL